MTDYERILKLQRRLMREADRLTEKVKNDEHLLATMINELEHDKGILIDIATGDVDNVWRDEGDTRQKIRKPRKKHEQKK